MDRRRVAVVTGAGRGLGRAVAAELARQGMDVAVLARSADQVQQVAAEIGELGVRGLAVTVDVRSSAAVATARDDVLEAFGAVDVLVNNAGSLLYKPLVPLPGRDDGGSPVSDDEWDSVLDVHLHGAMRMLREFGPSMLAQRYGRVVNVVSNVVRRAVPFTTVYDTAKGGLVQLTRSVAREWARTGVTVNAVAAGHFSTEMTREQFDDPDAMKRLLARVPARRAGELEEFGALVAFLCGESAGYITGETIGIDGGETL
ncbi:SDR family NAD(P)-dependent oxidoreductase [Nakamurella lactea]|uniref:SDR family NAD(P)-dependent oxidoreductase n=1 Tax=Nakamurella lactea TaxID=459515 RepID=UPI00048B07E4|nr:SDR family oxidoreductase [Nakamurella lactea]